MGSAPSCRVGWDTETSRRHTALQLTSLTPGVVAEGLQHSGPHKQEGFHIQLHPHPAGCSLLWLYFSILCTFLLLLSHENTCCSPIFSPALPSAHTCLHNHDTFGFAFRAFFFPFSPTTVSLWSALSTVPTYFLARTCFSSTSWKQKSPKQ